MAGFFFENPKQWRIDKGLSIDYDLKIHFDQLTIFQQNIHPLRPYFRMLVLSAFYKQWGLYSYDLIYVQSSC